MPEVARIKWFVTVDDTGIGRTIGDEDHQVIVYLWDYHPPVLVKDEVFFSDKNESLTRSPMAGDLIVFERGEDFNREPRAAKWAYYTQWKDMAAVNARPLYRWLEMGIYEESAEEAQVDDSARIVWIGNDLKEVKQGVFADRGAPYFETIYWWERKDPGGNWVVCDNPLKQPID